MTAGFWDEQRSSTPPPRKGDDQWAVDAMYAVAALTGSEPSWSRYFVHEGPPTSKGRARFTGHGTYTPQATRIAENLVAEVWRRVMLEPATGNLAVVAIFFRQNHQRVDTDNLLKLVLDAGTKAKAWADDSQVTTQLGILEYDPIRPRTVVVVFPIQSTLQRSVFTNTCLRCGKEFVVVAAARAKRKYCSTACAQPPAIARCARCGNEFRRHGSAQRYCSKTCTQQDPLHRQKLSAQRPWPKCQTCGGRVSRREYLQCSACAPKGRRLGSKNKAVA